MFDMYKIETWPVPMWGCVMFGHMTAIGWEMLMQGPAMYLKEPNELGASDRVSQRIERHWQGIAAAHENMARALFEVTEKPEWLPVQHKLVA